MNPDSKDLNALREDYLRQKFPGNLGDMVDQISPLPSRKKPKHESSYFGRLAVAAVVLLGLGLGLILTMQPRTPVAEQPTLKNRSGATNPPNDPRSISKTPMSGAGKRNLTPTKRSFFNQQMVLTTYRQGRLEQKNKNNSLVKGTSKPNRSQPDRKTNFWQSNRRQLATSLNRPKQSTETRTQNNKKSDKQPIQKRRWLKPRYEFKSIIDPLYKYRRS